ncbi:MULTISPECIES: sugar phosphate isomerase/epimerase family protein [unclassified Paenibacillus]|uniref:sugar phosphate isomerase/epimerase family protein n=1 Tax=unclassified Paenibacillus TaxID=185978 RepID=UPI00240709CB|nr:MULTISPECIES: sugar phosphate isomerase/epimerase family protein [unclassified Paenibacillus]MDF9839485.1 protein FrlC [Paenibacillus sp. PastF-2]MDF9846066.1 protein FrlC [Paenibacillus sp. PastM-2]MDF9852639.1 protein FrlC [Paenibacillus sp. PastF-1]MDH6477630.1 protein FrlC [Paenibacillus sp. PastH-2]MDH6505373.1 protein FrlC [Paenibacillus sp. PastM-3]
MIKIDQIAAANFHYKRYSLSYFLDSVARLGFKNIELWASGPHFHLDYYTPQSIRDLKQSIKDRSLNVICFTPEQSVYPISVSHPDPVYRKASVEFFKRHIEAAVELDCNQMLLTTGLAYLDEDESDMWKWCRESIGEICKTAEKEGVYLPVEAFTSFSTHVFNSAEHIAKMIREVGSPNLKGLADTDVMAVTGKDTIHDFIRELGDNLAYVHFVDGNPGGHLVPGEGKLPLDEALQALNNSGYKGYLGLELLDRRYVLEPEQAMKDSLSWFQKQFG